MTARYAVCGLGLSPQLSGASGSASAVTSTTTRSGRGSRPSTSTRGHLADDVDPARHEVVDGGGSVLAQHLGQRGLHRRLPPGRAAQVRRGQPALAQSGDGPHRGVGVEPPEACPVGQGQHGAGEAVAPEVGALPHLVGEGAGEGGDDRPTAHGAARVARRRGCRRAPSAGVLVAAAELGAQGVGRVEQVLGAAPEARDPRPPDGVDGIPRPNLVLGLAASRSADEQHPPPKEAHVFSIVAPRGPDIGGVSSGFLVHGPACSMSSQREATGAEPACGSPRWRDAAEQRERSVRATPRCYAEWP